MKILTSLSIYLSQKQKINFSSERDKLVLLPSF